MRQSEPSSDSARRPAGAELGSNRLRGRRARPGLGKKNTVGPFRPLALIPRARGAAPRRSCGGPAPTAAELPGRTQPPGLRTNIVKPPSLALSALARARGGSTPLVRRPGARPGAGAAAPRTGELPGRPHRPRAVASCAAACSGARARWPGGVKGARPPPGSRHRRANTSPTASSQSPASAQSSRMLPSVIGSIA
jgi:hypothetical protein